MLDEQVRPIPSDDGLTHINTHAKSRTRLGRILSPSFNIGDPINHPILGPFRTVENLWCYLNTGGTRDSLRMVEPKVARTISRLTPKYSCDRFRELITDATLIKVQSNSVYSKLMVENDLPFDHYYLKYDEKLSQQGDELVPIRPSHAQLYVSVLEDVRDIVRGKKFHEFVRFKDMNFKLL